MKKIVFVLAFLMTAAICAEGNRFHNRQAAISTQTFYDELLPYGEWIYTPDYGYAWRPYLDGAEDFRPYATGGNWVYTDLGWTWVSDYRWGWAAFHYGRWYFDDYLGWMWIPGNEWAPAWVTWGSYNDCWAWAPMGPNIHVNVNLNWFAPGFWWTFVPRSHFYSDHWRSHCFNQPVQVTNITYITNIYNGDNYRHNSGNWYHGPRVSDVERHAGSKVRRMQLVDADKPANRVTGRDRVSVYRPDVANTREVSKPGRYRNAETARTGQQITRTNDQNARRKPETGNITRSSDQTRREVGKTAERNAPRMLPPQRETKQRETKQQETKQRNDAGNRPEVRSTRKPAPVNPQPSRIEGNTSRSSKSSGIVKSNPSPRPAEKSRSNGASSSTGKRTR